uniref:olfactory receptor 4K3-like n=1 Tax=Podarcis muralis TaxID=64176 RepID=UPI0010A040AC|nr:olfactory receptor 4K3-like [Podarcis muralis]
MAWGNQTMVTEFVLLGLSETWEVQLVFFVFLLLLYMATFFINILTLSAIFRCRHLSDSPMFFLLAHLAFLDLCLSSFATPRSLFDFLAQHHVISFHGCMAQIFFLHLFGGSEMLLLVAMAIDRYVAISHPLHYATLMNRRHCMGLVLACWTGGLLHTTVQLVFTIKAPFCGPNLVHNFFCDLPFVIKLACTDIYPLEVMMVTNSGILSLVSFIALLLSYGFILHTICSMPHSKRTTKTASTCTSHLIVVTMYFGPCIVIYLQPYSQFMADKVLCIFYTCFTPLLNPTIYALKNKEMKVAMGSLLARLSGKVSTQGQPYH